jgi:hypothetical protein
MRLCEALRRPGLYVEREREPDGAARLTVVENVPDCADNREIMARARFSRSREPQTRPIAANDSAGSTEMRKSASQERCMIEAQ